MLLAIDIGNTNIHLGLWNSGSWEHSWRARTVAEKMPDEYATLIRNYLQSSDLGFKVISGVVIGSVVPRLTGVFTEFVERYIGQQPLLVSSAIKTGVRIAIDQPQQAGADRIANAAAVCALHQAPAVVVDFGTATNFDVVSSNGAYLGGAIAPGIGLAADALVSRAAKLHKVDLTPPPSPIGANTIHAMQSGIFWGYVGLVEGIVRRITKQLDAQGEKDVQIIATGGMARIFDQYTDIIDSIAPVLTLDGLRVIYDLNNGKSDEGM